MSDLVEGRMVEGLASELIATREQLEVVLQNIDAGVTVITPDGRFVYANDVAAQLIGVESREELLAQRPGDALGRFELSAEDGSPFAIEDLPSRRALVDGRPAEALVRFRATAGGGERV